MPEVTISVKDDGPPWLAQDPLAAQRRFHRTISLGCSAALLAPLSRPPHAMQIAQKSARRWVKANLQPPTKRCRHRRRAANQRLSSGHHADGAEGGSVCTRDGDQTASRKVRWGDGSYPFEAYSAQGSAAKCRHSNVVSQYVLDVERALSRGGISASQYLRFVVG